MARQLLSPTFALRPYWWDATQEEDGSIVGQVPRTADCVVVGGGVTGLSAALKLARAGLEVVVMEAAAHGYGASTRNHGFLGFSPFGGWEATLRSLGLEQTIAIYTEYQQALQFTLQLIEREQIECHLEQCGRTYFAFTQQQLDAKGKELEQLRQHLGHTGHVLDRNRVREEIGSSQYIGAVVYPGTAACHPALYHAGLLRAASRAGVRIVVNARMQRISRSGGSFTLCSSAGTTTAKHVVVATNGYTGSELPALRRKVIPVHAHIIATEPMGDDLREELFPRSRTFLDLRKCFHSWRLSPTENRLLFLGKTGSMPPSSPGRFCHSLHSEMTEIYPQIANLQISHYWSGQMGFSLDFMPHLGECDGVHYALAMCGTGLVMGAYLGDRIAARVLGSPTGKTPFEGPSFPEKPWYLGSSWSVPVYSFGSHLLGRLERRSKASAP